MAHRRALDTPLDRLHARRASERLAVVLPQAQAALAALRARGAQAELVGSLARGSFRLHSDVDFLVTEAGALSEGQIDQIISEHLRDAAFDVNYAARMSPSGLQIMRRDARRSV